MAWAEKLASGRWRGLYRDGGGKKRSVGTFPHKAKAVREAGAQESKARKRMWSDPEAYKRPWGEWCDEWWPTRAVEPSTLARDRNRRATHLDPRWSTCPIGAIRRQDVKAWAQEMRRAGVGPSTVQRAVHLLSASLAAAVDAEVIEHNPAARIKLDKGEQAGERFLSEGEYETVREQLPTAHHQLVTDVLVYTGLRWSELAGLHWHRVDLERAQVSVVETYSESGNEIKPYPKGRRVRVVPLPKHLVAALVAHRASSADSCAVVHRVGRCRSGLVFATATGTALRNSNWSPAWREAVEHSGIGHARLYDLRHTFASWMLQAGVTLAEVGTMMGHVSSQTTLIYAHLERKRSVEATTALDRRTA